MKLTKQEKKDLDRKMWLLDIYKKSINTYYNHTIFRSAHQEKIDEVTQEIREIKLKALGI